MPRVIAQLAWALASVGRYADALKLVAEIAKLKGDDANFCYGYACLLSIEGKVDEALAFLERSIKYCGNNDISHAKSDPDLATLRAQRATAFAELTTVKFEWRIDWGIFSDDICLVNKSPFALTGVNFAVQVTSTDSADWTARFNTNRIAAGETYRWNTRIISRGQNTKTNGWLSTDQHK